MSELPGYVGTPSSPESLLNPSRRNREVAKSLKTGPSTFNQGMQQSRLPHRPNYRPETRNPDEISLSSSASNQGAQGHEGPSQATKIEEMSKPVLFYGKPNQIDDLDTFCKVKFVADQTIDEAVKAGYCATLFRGPALSWLTTYLKSNELNDYGELIAQLRATFGLDETAQQGQYARALAKCKQYKSVQQYALQFKELAEKLDLPETVKKAQFVQGLKGNIQRAIIFGDNADDPFDDLIKEAARIDGELYNVTRQQGAHQRTGYAKNRDRHGRFKSHTPKRESYD